MTTTTRDWRQLSFTRNSARIDTALMLSLAGASEHLEPHYPLERIAEMFAIPVQGNVSAVERLREARAVVRYWPGHLLVMAAEADAPWHSLTEAPTWDDVDRCAMHEFVEGVLRRSMRWPDISTIRRFAGRAPTTPSRSVEGQATFDL